MRRTSTLRALSSCGIFRESALERRQKFHEERFAHADVSFPGINLDLKAKAWRPTRRTPVRLMARPPQFERSDPMLVKEAVKRLDPEDRARLLAWLLLYFNDDGSLHSPQISKRRQRLTLNGVEYWLARVPRRTQTP
jgi:hypothetical protein